MRKEDIKSLLKDVMGPNTKFIKAPGWVMCKCPMARWTHQKGADNTPSFGVHIHNDETSIFNCFTCKKKGPMSYFLKLMETYTGENYAKVIRALENDEAYQAELPEWDVCRERTAVTVLEPVPPEFLDIFEPIDEVPEYLENRGITRMQTIANARLRIDPDNDGTERIIFPVYGLDGLLYGFTGRATNDTTNPKVRDYFGLPKKDLLLGLHRITSDTNYVVVVEGLFDYLAGVENDYPALAVMHSTLTAAQADILKVIGLPTYLLYDDDKAGREGTQKAIQALRGYVPVMRCAYPRYTNDKAPKDPAEMTEHEWGDALDEAEMM